MREIVLSRGYVAKVDDDDYDWLRHFDWHYSNGYAKRTHRKNGTKQTVSMHREVLRARSFEEVDHINGDRLDNQKANLRLCSEAENTWNIARSTRNTTGYKGVSLHKISKSSQYRATIKANGRKFSLGCFATKEEAARAYNDAARKLHGEFARLNHVE